MTSKKTLLVTLLALGLVAFVAVTQASATQILAFGQTSNSNTVTGTAVGSSTTISGTGIALTVTQIAAGIVTPFTAFLSFSMTNTGAAMVSGGGDVTEPFGGSFEINSLPNNTGTNFLSGIFTDEVNGFLLGEALTLSTSDPPHTLLLASSVIPILDLPDALAWSFTNLPPLAVADGTIQSFTASVSGTVSASEIPEPTSMLLLGTGLLGLVGVTRRRLGRSGRQQATS